MDRTERFHKLDLLLSERKALSFSVLQAQLEVSPATLKRDLQYMRDRLHAPIVWDRDAGGYRYEKSDDVAAGSQFELPGLWFNASEIHALLTMQHLLAKLDSGGLLGPHIAPLAARLAQMLGSGANADTEVAKRIRVLTVGARKFDLPHTAPNPLNDAFPTCVGMNRQIVFVLRTQPVPKGGLPRFDRSEAHG